MKKLIANIIICSILLGTTCLAASSINLSDLTDDELIELQYDVLQEMMDRHVNKTASLKAGTYICGIDFPAGSYDINPQDGVTEYSVTGGTVEDNGDLGGVDIYESYNEEDTDKTYHGTFVENMWIEVDEPFTMTIFSGAVFE